MAIMQCHRALIFLIAGLSASLAHAAPDEDKLGRRVGYPIGNATTWYYSEPVRVGSFTHQAEIKGIFHGKPNILQPAAAPMPLFRATLEPDIRWNAKGASNLTVDDYLARQRIMGLIVVKDRVVQVERYQYRSQSERSLHVQLDGQVDHCACCRHRAAGKPDQFAGRRRGTLCAAAPRFGGRQYDRAQPAANGVRHDLRSNLRWQRRHGTLSVT